MFDKIIRLSFIFSLVFIIFFVGYISHKYKAKKIFQTLEPLISSFEVYFDLDLDKKLGERKLRKRINNSSPEFDTNFSLMNKPSESFNKYLFIKQDNSGPVLMDNPNNIVWTWNLNKFRNPSKIIPYHLFENGDLILGRYESKGLFRINKDGKILWNKNYYNHHWISVDDENLYVPGTLFIDRQDLKDKIYEGSFVKNCKSEHKSRFGTIMIIDQKNGGLKKEIFLIDAFYKDNKSREIIEKFSYNLEKFNYNVIIANIYETYNFLVKEIDKNYSKQTLKENYIKILTLMMPVLPHIVSEAIQDLNIKDAPRWPKSDPKYLQEEFVNIVIQINGKKKSLVKIEKDLEDKDLIAKVKKDQKISLILKDKNLLKYIVVKNKLVNFIVK